MQNHNARIVALDVGEKRIGVATANVVARLASPLKTLDVGKDIHDQIKQLLAEQTAIALVVGLPRNLQGNDTAQTKATEAFVEELRQQISIPVYWQDEALTSHLSEQDLQASGNTYQKGDIDALAATYILEDFLASKQEISA